MEINAIVSDQWRQLRQMTYDLLNALDVSSLGLKLNFERSQSIGYQFWCMLGAQESWISLIESGKWEGFSCSVTSLNEDSAIENLRRQMHLADEKLMKTLATVDLAQEFAGGKTALSNYLNLVEHESHHQGQLINFIYAHDLLIPGSWEAKWNLKRS